MKTSLKYQPIFGFLTIGVLTLLMNLLVFQTFLLVGLGIYVSAFLGNLTSIAINYAGLTKVFNKQRKLTSVLRYIGAWIFYYFATIWLIMIFIGNELSPLSARVATLIVLTPINYLVQQNFVFGKK
jgi:hypothetical protein